MDDLCMCPSEAGRDSCALRSTAVDNRCGECGQPGKAVQGQTVKALLAISLRAVTAEHYLFCPTQSCHVVYFAANYAHTFTVDQLRERVYQKQPRDEATFVCYCFRHRVGDLRAAADQQQIIDDINAGIQGGQCACDLHNPQGSCCLGNVRALVRATRPASH